MSPGSDWDLLLLHTGRGEVASFARAFTTALWDVRVHLGSFDLGVLVGEELGYRGHDEAYEAALRTAVEVLDL